MTWININTQIFHLQSVIFSLLFWWSRSRKCEREIFSRVWLPWSIHHLCWPYPRQSWRYNWWRGSGKSLRTVFELHFSDPRYVFACFASKWSRRSWNELPWASYERVGRSQGRRIINELWCQFGTGFILLPRQAFLFQSKEKICMNFIDFWKTVGSEKGELLCFLTWACKNFEGDRSANVSDMDSLYAVVQPDVPD